MNDIFDNAVFELRRGVIVLAALSILQNEGYGYSVMRQLADCGLEVDQGTLYPLLRRLESQGLLLSDWRLEEARPRRYYKTSADGQIMLEKLKNEWQKINVAVHAIVN